MLSQLRIILFPFLLVFIRLELSLAWGSDSHRVIAKIALDIAGKTGNRLYESLIDENERDSASFWADLSVAESRYPESANYHFSHTPYRSCAEFDFERDCGFRGSGLCLVSGLSRFMSIVVDPYSSREDRQDALKFVLHLVGDMHQPLHTGFREDAGGTAINVTTPDAIHSLHEVFDFDIISRYKSVMKPPHWESVAAKASIMIQNNPGVRTRYPLTFDLGQFLETPDTMAEYAATIVSEMTTTVTCKYAYKNEAGSFIENNDELSTDYYKSRTSGVLTLLVKAGIRLGALLDALAIEYNNRKTDKEAIEYEERIERAIARMSEPSPSPEPRPGSNRYAVLAIDCDPELLVEDHDSEEETTLPNSCTSDITPKSPPKKKTKVVSAASPKPQLPPILYEGVDLTPMIVIRRKGQYIITDKRLVKSHRYLPANGIAFNVRFNTTSDVRFHFDLAVFPHTMSDELAVRTILKLNGIVLQDTESISSYFNTTGLSRDKPYDFKAPSGSELIRPGFTVSVSSSNDESPEDRKARIDLVDNVNARLKAAHAQRQAEIQRKFDSKWSLRFATISHYMESQVRAQRSKIVVFTKDQMKMFVLISTLERPVTEVQRFNFIPIETMGINDGGMKAGLLIDPSIFDGYVTGSIVRTLQAIERSNKSLSRRHTTTRPSLKNELDDICLIFYGTDPERMSRRLVVANFMAYPGDDLSRYLVFEWTMIPGTL